MYIQLLARYLKCLTQRQLTDLKTQSSDLSLGNAVLLSSIRKWAATLISVISRKHVEHLSLSLSVYCRTKKGQLRRKVSQANFKKNGQF